MTVVLTEVTWPQHVPKRHPIEVVTVHQNHSKFIQLINNAQNCRNYQFYKKMIALHKIYLNDVR